MKLMLVVIFLISSSSFEVFATPIKMFCHSPTSVFYVYTKKDFVHLKLVMPYGSSMTHVSSGAITPLELEKLRDNAKNIATLGNQLHFRWPLDKCITSEEDIFDCRYGEMVEFVNSSVTFPALKSVKVSKKAAKGNYEQMNMQLIFQMDGESHIIGGIYGLDSCIK